MSTPHLRFEAVWKQFRRGQSHDSLRDLLPNMARRIAGKPSKASSGSSKEFFALSDVSFSIEPGEVLGIIGPNGAGKSTTLKILNRIMDPSRGQVHVSGRVGALIEVSAGFHQDLTGRQNVYLQGAIMGMKRREVQSKFDAIVDFSGIEDFIDTPVKRYSSGMNARLGFSIAAHMSPEVLIIDEVLAVGDYAFQAKAYGRIKEMAGSGAPVVIVSHQLNRVAEICTKAILLERGRIALAGTPQECIDAHLHGGGLIQSAEPGSDDILRFETPVVEPGQSLFSGQQVCIRLQGTSLLSEAQPTWTLGLRVIDQKSGASMFTFFAADRGLAFPIATSFVHEVGLQLNLRAGSYRIQPFVWDTERGGLEMTSGPQTTIEVMETSRSWGQMQLNGTWTDSAHNLGVDDTISRPFNGNTSASILERSRA